jgi:hypothetical protein
MIVTQNALFDILVCLTYYSECKNVDKLNAII